MTSPVSPVSRGAVIALYVSYGVMLIPLVVVAFVALAFWGFGGEFIAPSGAFLLAFLLLWPIGLVLALVFRKNRTRSLRLGFGFLGAELIAIVGFVVYIALL
jgi:hypothetical protein